VPFLRFSRDNRGYEHTYLVQPPTRRGKGARPRVLYWFRSPPGLRLGRPAFDEEVCRALEVQNPGVVFDWDTLARTPFPPVEPEHWRERRKAERAARLLRRERDAQSESITPETGQEASSSQDEPLVASDAPEAAPGEDAAQAGEITERMQGSPIRKPRRRGGRHRRRSSAAASQAAEPERPVGDPLVPPVPFPEDPV
jgi:hypothetical protein